MKLLKKIGGYLLMIVALLLAIAVLATSPSSIINSIHQIQKDGVVGTGYLVGTMIANLFFVLIIIFMIKKGLKLIQNRKIESDKVEL
jgi:hypothetical protein